MENTSIDPSTLNEKQSDLSNAGTEPNVHSNTSFSGKSLSLLKQSSEGTAIINFRNDISTELVDKGEWSESLQSVLESPESSLPIKIVSGGIIFLSLFGTWAFLGQIEEVGRATGQLIPQGDVIRLESMELGTVVQIALEEGEEVQEGQLIVELDSIVAETEIERLEESVNSLEKRLIQLEALISETEQENISRMAIANAAVNTHEVLIQQNQSDIDAQRNLIELFEDELVNHEERLEKLRPSLEAGVISREYFFNAEQAYREKIVSHAQSVSELDRLLTDNLRLQSELSQKQSEVSQTQSSIQQDLQEMESQRVQLKGEIAQERSRLAVATKELTQLSIMSPTNGTISTLNVQNIGEVTEPGQTIVEIAPEGAPLVLKALLPTNEAGFAEVGMPAQIKIDAFPYQDFGVINGTVEYISPDVEPHEQLGPCYELMVSFDQDTISNRGQEIALKVGQTGEVEVVLRRQRIIDVLFDPFQKINNGGLSL